VRRLETGARDLAREAGQRLLLAHADDAVEISGHADVGDERGAAGQDAVVGSRDMRVRADDEARASVAEMAHRLLFARRLAMEVDDDRIRALAKRTRSKLAIDRR